MGEKEKPKRSGEPDPQFAPCPICGETDFEWGTPVSDGGVWFRPHGGIFFTKATGLKARECVNCGNVQLFTKRHDLPEIDEPT